MWGRWKKKISRFLFEEEEENNDQSYQALHHNNQGIRTRMTYQYPAEKSFRFPVIPDQPHRKEESEVPAFQRKRSRNTEQPKPDSSQEEQQMRKVYKSESEEPFTPSDVPSPIYGFQKRNEEKTIEDVPAFQRKQQHDNGNHDPIKDQAAAANGKPLNFEHETGSSERPNLSSLSSNDSKTEQGTGNFSRPDKSGTIEKTTSDNKTQSEITETQKPAHRDNSKRRTRKPGREQSSPKTPPFNVLMSANDKQNQLKRKQSDQQLARKEQPIQNSTVPYHLLDDPVPKTEQDKLWMRNQQQVLEKTLKHFNVRAKVVKTTQGPSVTRFEVQPEPGVKVSKIKNLSDDLKLNLAARDIRIEAPIPGKNTIGIEIPNQHSQMVSLQEIFDHKSFQTSASPLTIGLGLSIEGDPLVSNIQKMPHGLIAGATGSGKSVCINTILISLLYKASHDEVKFMLIDPKMVELAPYNGIPHLISPVITDVKAATAALKWAVREMEARYDAFVHEGVRDIERFNQKMTRQNRSEDKMPFIVIVIDELADLMMVSPQDVEDAISRIAQKARACGIHLLLATQRPSVDVITGLIKANIPTRIAFSVSSQVDSKTIIDTGGAEKLLGKGDMLFTENGAGKSIRLQGAFVSDEEIERVTDYARSIAEPEYQFEQEQLLEQVSHGDYEDDLLSDAIDFVVGHNSASTSLLQRQFKIGYNRAARLMDAMEERGIIGQQNGSKPREVLVSAAQEGN
ncbi:DNA segregation ATPase FtsK/SpoIIIE, S-DNA-T family [Lentibacillus halodurans]|uniref:DNA segregation ATPase FtsK/SpoIIIE, S-DNA-T family n=1 Tax=Lentibacillus halodurans TaxID=237679 RepID=A0A1I1AKI9_9BACI|nr:DNA translocase FtsK [Lentibacillus halodurans]SFB37008.1 DNA segregation ATPase FtsK/SpoIIIE, S-DNA-T family [Lentibacillus halodurans]